MVSVVMIMWRLDDFIEVSSPSEANSSFNDLGSLLKELGLEENLPKAKPPTTRLVVLGILVDTVDMTLSVDPARMVEIQDLLHSWVKQETCTKKELQSFLGKLCFVIKCVRQSRVFINRIVRLLREVSHSRDSIVLDDEFRKDVHWWIRFMVQYNGVSIIHESWWNAPDVVFTTDSTLVGCGGLTDVEYFHTKFPIHILALGLDINALEILGALVSVRLWGSSYAGQNILIYCDNLQAVTAINSGKTRHEYVGLVVRNLWLEAASFGFHLRAVHLPGVDNRLADSLSRWDISHVYSRRFLDAIKGQDMRECFISDEMFMLCADL